MKNFQEKYTKELLQESIKIAREKSELENVCSQDKKIRSDDTPFFAFALESIDSIKKEDILFSGILKMESEICCTIEKEKNI